MASGRITHVIGDGEHACLLLHGFSGSPREMLPLAEALAGAGWTAAVAELAGHSSPRALAQTTWTEWIASAADAYGELRARGGRVALLGLSMGGAVALILAAAERPAAVVTISTPVRIRPMLARASRVASRVMPYAPVLMKLGPREREMKRYRSPYRRIPLRAMGEVERLLEAMRQAIPRLRAPVLVVQGRRDWVIPRESGAELVGLAGQAEAHLLWLPRSGHVATLDRDRGLLVREVTGFLQTHLGEAARGKGGRRGAAD